MKHGNTAGDKPTPEYWAWTNMRQRCNNPNFHQYSDYGGRGIKVCEEWNHKHAFPIFLEYMGRRPSSKHSIDRIDNDRGYAPGNVRWATKEEQNRNMSKNVYITLNGETLTMYQWSKKLGISNSSIRTRLIKGASPEEALSTKDGRRSRSRAAPKPKPAPKPKRTITHGISAYNAIKCRCDICRDAMVQYQRDRRAAKKLLSDSTQNVS